MLNVGVIGAGWVTTARHIPALKRSRRCRIVGIIDRRNERAQAAARRFGIPHFGTDLDVPWMHSVDAVTVGVSPMSHFEVAAAALERGKHVLLEKPMCLSVAEGETLVDLAARQERTLAIVHNFQFSRSVLRARAELEAGNWGRVTALHGFQLGNDQRRLPSWYEQLPLGLFYDESPHLLYLLKAFGREIEFQHARVIPSSHGRATPAVVQADFQCDFPATLYMNFEAPVSEWYLLVSTERGLAIIDIFRDILQFIPGDGRHTAKDILRSSWSLVRGHAWGFFTSGVAMLGGRLSYGNDEVVKRFLDAVEGRAPLWDIDADSGLEVLKLQHAIVDHSLCAR